MATVSSLGVGSNLDLNSLLTNLMSAEQQPLIALQQKEASYQSRISALGTLKGGLSSLQTAAAALIPPVGTSAADKYASYRASVADATIASATAGAGAIAGSYSLEVSSLAKAQRLVSPSAAGYTDATAPIASGTLTIEFGTLASGTFTADSSRTKTLTIDSTNHTLGGLRDAINAANGGVAATIVKGTAGAQLVLSSTGTGLSNVMRLSGLTGFDYDPAANSGTLTQDALQGGQTATNAAFTLNGIAATSTSNTVSGVLDGVTLNLAKQTTVGTPTTLTVSKDLTANLTSALNAFVKAYNDAAKSMTDLGSYDAATKKAGALQGNSTLRTAQSQMRSLVFGATAGGTSVYQRLSNIGVSLAKDGTLSLDSAKLSAATSADFAGVTSLVSAVGTAYKSAIEGLVGTTGSITAATDGANRQIADLTKRQQVMSDRLTAIESRYRKEFTALDSLVSSMNQTSAYLTQQLASLSSTSK